MNCKSLKCTISSIFFQIVFKISYKKAAAEAQMYTDIHWSFIPIMPLTIWDHYLVSKKPIALNYYFCLPIKLCKCLFYLLSIYFLSLFLFCCVYISALFPPHFWHPSCFRLMSFNFFFPGSQKLGILDRNIHATWGKWNRHHLGGSEDTPLFLAPLDQIDHTGPFPSPLFLLNILL